LSSHGSLRRRKEDPFSDDACPPTSRATPTPSPPPPPHTHAFLLALTVGDALRVWLAVSLWFESERQRPPAKQAKHHPSTHTHPPTPHHPPLAPNRTLTHRKDTHSNQHGAQADQQGIAGPGCVLGTEEGREGGRKRGTRRGEREGGEGLMPGCGVCGMTPATDPRNHT